MALSTGKGWTQTWTWTRTRPRTHHSAMGGQCSWGEPVDRHPVSCPTAPPGVMALSKSLNISALASPAPAFYQMLSAICEGVQLGPTPQNWWDHSGPEQPLSIGLVWQASKNHPEQPLATHPEEFPYLLTCIRDRQSFCLVWTLNIYSMQTPSAKVQANPEEPPPHRSPGL